MAKVGRPYFIFIFIFISCSHSYIPRLKYNKRGFDSISYKVESQSSPQVSKWVKFPEKMARERSLSDEYLYFSFITGPKFSKEIACNLIKAYGRDQIADQMILALKLGPERKAEKENYLQEDILLYFQDNIPHAEIIDSYWEERKYFEVNDSGEDVKGYICALWVKVSKRDILELIKNGKSNFIEVFSDIPGLANEVKNWEQDFLNYRKKHY